MNILVGILGLQGSYLEHQSILHKMKINTIILKYPKDIEKITHLIIPGGESTTISNFILQQGFLEPLKKFILIEKKPVLGTCAGAILLSKQVIWNNNTTMGLIPAVNINIQRNAYGSQVESFQEIINLKYIGDFNCIFIRAPKIIPLENAKNNDYEILGTKDKNPIMIKRKNILLCTFHPELESSQIHEYFLQSF